MCGWVEGVRGEGEGEKGRGEEGGRRREKA